MLLNMGKVKAMDSINTHTYVHSLHMHYHGSPSVQNTAHTVEYEGELVSAVYCTHLKERL